MGQRELHDLLVEVADDVPPIGPSVIDGAVRHARHRRTARWVAAPVAVLVVITVVFAGLPALRRDALQPAAPGSAGPALPGHLADFPLLMASVTDAPAGRAAAVLGYLAGDNYHTVLVGADRESYRVVDLEFTDGASFESAALTPDGLTAVMERGRGQVEILDLPTGHTRRIQLPDHSSGAIVFGISPDGRTMIAGTSVQLFNRDAVPYLVDMRTGATTRFQGSSITGAAFSPDGQRIAVERPGSLAIVDRAGREQRRIDIGKHTLAGSTAWSPDGRVLVTVERRSDTRASTALQFFAADAATPHSQIPSARKIAGASVLGWQSADRVVVQEWRGDVSTIAVLGVRDGSRRVLAGGSPTVTSVAAGLLPNLGSRPGGEPDFGPWPDWLRWGLVVAILLALVLVLLLVKVARWAIRVNRRPFPT